MPNDEDDLYALEEPGRTTGVTPTRMEPTANAAEWHEHFGHRHAHEGGHQDHEHTTEPGFPLTDFTALRDRAEQVVKSYDLCQGSPLSAADEEWAALQEDIERLRDGLGMAKP